MDLFGEKQSQYYGLTTPLLFTLSRRLTCYHRQGKSKYSCRRTIRSIQITSHFHTNTTYANSYGISPVNITFGPFCKTNFSSGDNVHYKKLVNNKSPGHYLIPNKVVKNLPTKVIVHLTHIYNSAFHLSYFPTI